MEQADEGAPKGGAEAAEQIITFIGAVLLLYGDQLTLQFQSTMRGFRDYLLLAFGPVGVGLATLNTIRIAGPKWLKLCVGRSREEPAVIEKELLPSTSAGVCEAWTGRNISRIKGSLPLGNITTLIITEKGRILDLQRRLYLHTTPHHTGFHWKLQSNDDSEHRPGDFKFMVNGSPNLSWSLKKPSSPWLGFESRSILAVVGALVQSGAWVFISKLAAVDTQDGRNGVICYFVGAGLTFIALVASAYIADAYGALWEQVYVFTEEPGALVDDAGESMGQSTCFGIHLTYPPEPVENNAVPTPTPDGGVNTVEYYGIRAMDTTLADQCLQELSLLFVEAIATRIQAVGGCPTKLSAERHGARAWEHTLLKDLAEQIKNNQINPDIEDTLALVVPVFMRHNILPQEGLEE